MLLNVKPTDGPTVHLADNSTIKATSVGELAFDNSLSSSAKQVHLFSELQTPLLSLGQFCDDDCEVTLRKHDVSITKNNKVVVKGTRNFTDGLWDIPLPTSPLPWNLPRQQSSSHHANVILRKDKSKMELGQWLHACAGSPSKSTFIQAIRKGNFITWPGLTSELISKHLVEPEATIKGHFNQERKNLQSTKPSIRLKHSDDIPISTPSPETDDLFFPTSDTLHNKRTQNCFITVDSFEKTAKAYSDQTGAFPYKSSRGNQYIMIVYDFDSNAILQEPLRDRTAGEINRAWTVLFTKLSTGGSTPELWILDNEMSTELQIKMTKYNINFQLVPPHNHRRNSAERAIQTFKNHFLAILASCDPDFPLSEWDRLLDQAEVTLNLLRNSRMNPKLSSYAYLFGNFDFNATPFGPPGTKVQVHVKTQTRNSWAYHSEPGWYVGRSPLHYRCYECYIPKTHKTRNADTVHFFPTILPYPSVKLDDFLRQATSDIISILQKPPTTPVLECGDERTNAIVKLATLINKSVSLPVPSASPTPNISTALSTTLPKVSTVLFAKPLTSIIPPCKRHSLHTIPSPLPHATVSVPRVLQSPPSAIPPTASDTDVPAPRVNLPPRTLHQITHDAFTQTYQKKSPQPCNYRTESRQGTSFRNLAVQHLIANLIFPSVTQQANHIFHPITGKKETLDSLLKGDDSVHWKRSLSNEWGRLAQGNDHGVKATDTIEFIAKSAVPSGRKVTYGSFVCDFKPLKEQQYRIRLVAGGDKLDYDDDPASPTASLLQSKLLLNSTISDAKDGARFMSADLKDYFLATPMETPEYMRSNIRHIPDDIIAKYNLRNIVTPDGWIYIKIKKGMYGLKQAAILAYQQLVTNLAKHGYTPCKYSVGLWTHATRRTKFCLCVDDFGIKYFSKDDADHLITSLRTSGYTVTTDWDGKNYCGLYLDWHYDKGYVDISMPDYVLNALKKFRHQFPLRPCHAPHQWNRPVYGQKIQFAKDEDTSDVLTEAAAITRIQQIVGTFLYYGRGIEYWHATIQTNHSNKRSNH